MAKSKKVASKESGNEKKNSKVIILIVLLLILLIGSICFTGYLFLTKNNTNTASEKVIDEGVYELGSFSVNLADRSPMRYAKITMSLAYDRETKLEVELAKKHNKMRDYVNSVLMSKKADELKSENIPVVKKEILDGINGMLGNDKALNIYITEILIQ